MTLQNEKRDKKCGHPFAMLIIMKLDYLAEAAICGHHACKMQ